MPLESVYALFSLFTMFQVKHFLGDFPLQSDYMLKKSLSNWDFLPPLIAHCLVHSSITLIYVLMINSSLWWLFILDFTLHFFMDRIKSGPQYLGRINDKTPRLYWSIFGFDQMFHHLTNYVVIFFIVTTPGSHLGQWSLYLLKN